MKKIINIIFAGLLLVTLCACTIQIGGTVDEFAQTEEREETVETNEASCDLTNLEDIDQINQILNAGDLSTSGRGNVVAVIPITHINGPKDIDQFYAFVNFKYASRNYIKYQVTYLSCTCRAANVNYWQTAYVELTLPESKNPLDSKIRFLSFDDDSSAEGDNYLAGFWGDTGTSHPMPGTNVMYDYNENAMKDGQPFPVSEQVSLKKEYISFFPGKDGNYIKSIAGCSSTVGPVDNIDPKDYASGEGRENYTLDAFTGASVSTNNIILMLDALYDYHATDAYFSE